MKQENWIAFALAVALCSPLGAGVVFEIETTDHEQSPPRVENIQISVEGRNLKMGIAGGKGGGRGEMIFRGGRREMVVVDHENKAYFVMDEETIRQIAGQVSGVMAQMQEALKNVPEGQRAMVEKMMKQGMPKQVQVPKRPVAEVRKTGDRGEENGYPCVRYDVLVNGTKVRDVWVTDWGNIEGGDEVADVFREMADFFSEMLDAVGEMAGGFGDMGADTGIFNDLEAIGGFPVVTREFGDDGSLEGESRLRSAKRQTLDPAAFEPPPGYNRREMFGGR
ncbi:MAG: hypothetical protein O7A98_11420 [Acidobacteria bacterium]|nr:hypothetical protein [Acidobacteriota bacterium]